MERISTRSCCCSSSSTSCRLSSCCCFINGKSKQWWRWLSAPALNVQHPGMERRHHELDIKQQSTRSGSFWECHGTRFVRWTERRWGGVMVKQSSREIRVRSSRWEVQSSAYDLQRATIRHWTTRTNSGNKSDWRWGGRNGALVVATEFPCLYLANAQQQSKTNVASIHSTISVPQTQFPSAGGVWLVGWLNIWMNDMHMHCMARSYWHDKESLGLVTRTIFDWQKPRDSATSKGSEMEWQRDYRQAAGMARKYYWSEKIIF